MSETTARAGKLASEAVKAHLEFVQQGGLEIMVLEGVDAKGILVAEGDSWFDYPGSNVLESLEWRFGYDVRSVAHNGDTLEEIVYNERQLAKLVSKLRKIVHKGQRPRAVLVSGGGNDMAGNELAILLNHRNSGLETVNDDISVGIINSRLQTAWLTYIEVVTVLCEQIFGESTIPIFVHGYDYPVPDGRGFLGGHWFLPGPWLRPAFRRKGYEADRSDLSFEMAVMKDLIDRYNHMLIAVTAQVANAHYVDIPGTLSNHPDTYRDHWRDELHPTDDGFHAVAAKFDTAIEAVT